MGQLFVFHIWQTNPTAAQDQTQGYDLVHPIVHPICDLLEQVKGPDPKLQDLQNKRQQQGIQQEH